jgi:WD40 repeat protein
MFSTPQGVQSETTSSDELKSNKQRTFVPQNSCHLCVACGALVCVGFADHSVRIVALSTGAVSQTILYHSDVVTCVSFSDDGTFVAFGSADCTVSIWDGIPTELAVAESIRPNLSVPFQHAVFSAQRFRRPVVSNVQSDKEIAPAAVQLSPCHVLHGHTAPITSVVLDRSNRLAFSGASDNSCLIHCLDSGRCEHVIFPPSPPFFCRSRNDSVALLPSMIQRLAFPACQKYPNSHVGICNVEESGQIAVHFSSVLLLTTSSGGKVLTPSSIHMRSVSCQGSYQ